MSGGFDVNPRELRQFAGKLDGYRGTAGEIAGLVAKADVGDKSWGVVGLFVKDNYTQMLGDLNDLFTDLQDGLQSQLGVGTGANAGIDKPIRNFGAGQKAGEYDNTGADQSKEQTERYLDI